ncbi:hypothetical protein ACJJTC_003412, partial [Scirpophaga incertulas]
MIASSFLTLCIALAAHCCVLLIENYFSVCLYCGLIIPIIMISIFQFLLISKPKLIVFQFLLIVTKSINVERTNILFVVIDDMRFMAEQELSNLPLPNIHKMAAKSVNFRNAFAQQALCAPSRNSFLTGRRPDSLHLYDFYSYWRKSVGNYSTIPQFFKERGYVTYSVGKVFHPGKSSNFTDDYPYSWSTQPYHPPTEKYKDAAVCADSKYGELHRNLICPVTVSSQPGKSLPDLQSVKYAIELLTSGYKDETPFFLAVGFHKPHIPLKFPKKYLSRISKNIIHMPKYPKIPKQMPLVAWHPWTDVRHRDDIERLNITFPFGTMPSKWTLKIKRSYYASLAYIDHLIGKLLAHVNLNNTLVVLTSDHGWSLGENGLWAKYSNFNVAVKVPLLFLVPGLGHRIVSTPVEMVDIFPTLVDIVGYSQYIRKCRKMDMSTLCFDGESLLPYMKPKLTNLRSNRYAISQYPRPSVYPKNNSDKPRLKDIKVMGYSIKSKKFRYTEWISFNNTSFKGNWDNIYGIELYDHSQDPFEGHNLCLEYVAIDCKPSQDKNGEISSSEHQLEQSEESSVLEEDDEKDSTYISDEEASSVSTDDDYLDTASDLDITPVNPAEV